MTAATTWSVASIIGLLFIAAAVEAHKPSDSYLTLVPNGRTIDGQWDVALRDLNYAIGLDSNDDGRLTWGEVRSRLPEIHDYVLSRLDVTMGSIACEAQPTEDLIDHHTDGAYAVLKFVLECPHPTLKLRLQYRLFFDLDPQHRGLVKVESPEGVTSLILSAEHAEEELVVGASRRWGTLLSYAHEGVHHIWGGMDHVLFLLALLLPAVLRRDHVGRRARWVGVDGLRPAACSVAAVVTAFTAAHSITLTLAALRIVVLPSRLVESVIAASVALAAINNLVPTILGRRWIVAFVFGLVHGFGFAGALGDLGLVEHAKILALAGFNIGVEAGQLVLVAVFLPIAYALRHVRLYSQVVCAGGSAAIVVMATVWCVERAGDLQLLPF